VGERVTLFLCGDVMTGRGVDQILGCPSAPEIHESYVRDAREYVALAEQASGPIPRSVDPGYVWGDALAELRGVAAAARIVNLEVSVTRSAEDWPDKGIHYRMHPANVACLTAPGIDVCALANNHVLDYGYPGLEETLATLTAAGLKTAGAGRNLAEARRPAIVDRPGGGRVLVLSCGTRMSGIPPAWSATAERAGVDMLKDLSNATADQVVERVGREKRPGDIVSHRSTGAATGDTRCRGATSASRTGSSTAASTSCTATPRTIHARSRSTTTSSCSTAAATSSTTTRGSRDTRSSGATWS
jgi:poly-gamma-glutamate capsule biosynthesis protein CapA/YwtB (metallophosphatase superfamily)